MNVSSRASTRSRTRSRADRRNARTGHRRRFLIAVAAVLLALGIVLGFAAPAGAHATVVSTNPVDGQVLPQSPETVQIQFSEQVSIDLGGLTVLDSDGNTVSEGSGELTGGGELLKTTVPADLDDGSYVANYRVVSADGHPVTGAVVFGIGDGTVIDSSVRGLADEGDPPYEVAAAFLRFVTYLGALLAGGLAVFATFVHDQRGDRRAIERLTRTAAVVGAVGMIGWIAAQAALSTGNGISAMTDPSTLQKTMADGLGWQALVLLLGLAASYAAVQVRRLVVAQSLAFYGCLAVGFSFIFWGHAREAPNTWIAMSADAIHAIAAAIWFGGLVGLGLTLRSRRRLDLARTMVPVGSAGDEVDSRDELSETTDAAASTDGVVMSTAEVVVRFSTVAAFSLTALIVAGLALAWQEVGSLDALVTTTYGRLVIAKSAAVAVIVAMAGYNRFRLVPEVARAGLASEREGEPGDEVAVQATNSWARLMATVRVEALLIVAVLAITGVLVNVVPARTTGNDAAIYDQTITQNDMYVNLVVVPAQVGRNSLHIQYSDATGRPIDTPRSITIEMTLADQGLGPLEPDVIDGGPGHFLAEGAQIPVTGAWQITLVARVSDFETVRTTFEVPIT